MGRFALAAALLAAGCSGPASSVIEVPPELRHVTKVVPAVADRHPYGDVTKLAVGQWARYADGSRSFTLAAVGKEGADLWIEVIEEGEIREVSARLVSPSGIVKRAFYGEISKDGPSEVVAQTLEQSTARPPRPASGARDVAEEKIRVGGTELAAKRVRVRSEDADGRLLEEVTWWHSDVPPLYAGSADGGLVRRKTREGSIELLGFGSDAKPLLVIK